MQHSTRTGYSSSPPGVPQARAGPAVDGRRSGVIRRQSLAFHGAKGGVGTTTLAAEAAFHLGATGLEAVVLDLDLDRGDMDFRLDVPFARGRLGVADVLALSGELDHALLEKVLSRTPCGARLLPSAAAAEGGSPGGDSAGALIEMLREAFDCAIIDTPCRADGLTVSALRACDRVVVVTTPEVSSVGLAGRAIERLASSGIERGAISIVVNRAGCGDSFSPGDIASFLSARVAAVIPEQTARCRRLSDGGRSLSSERSRLSRELERLMLDLFG
jgi:Flp pilus assembly CpaE family ATPase